MASIVRVEGLQCWDRWAGRRPEAVAKLLPLRARIQARGGREGIRLNWRRTSTVAGWAHAIWRPVKAVSLLRAAILLSTWGLRYGQHARGRGRPGLEHGDGAGLLWVRLDQGSHGEVDLFLEWPGLLDLRGIRSGPPLWARRVEGLGNFSVYTERSCQRLLV